MGQRTPFSLLQISGGGDSGPVIWCFDHGMNTPELVSLCSPDCESTSPCQQWTPFQLAWGWGQGSKRCLSVHCMWAFFYFFENFLLIFYLSFDNFTHICRDPIQASLIIAGHLRDLQLFSLWPFHVESNGAACRFLTALVVLILPWSL